MSSIAIREDGSAGPPKRVTALTGSLPDGVALAADGTMFVGCYRPDRIYRIPPSGGAEAWAENPDGIVLNQPTNLTFAGPNLDRIVVANLGGWTLSVAPAGGAGAPLHYPRIT